MDETVKQKFDTYPDEVRIKLMQVRKAVFEVAEEEGIKTLIETLKWGEPSYLAEGGSTLRMDWKPKSPDHFYVYFHCKTKLVETFREIYGDVFSFDGNRAIVFSVANNLPIKALKHCVSMALRYHKIKHLPMLGA